jgi:PHD/YefM family antitoxin component YafN of YafNO toxin-antitoxin module
LITNFKTGTEKIYNFTQTKIIMTLSPHFLTDKKGKKVAVQLSVKEYEYLIEELEMKEDVALYKKVKADKNESYIPLEEYLKKRKKK